MRLLFQIDTKGYDREGTAFIHRSARCINIKSGLAAMVHSVRYDYYVFPGSGIEKNESRENALIREAREEAGRKEEIRGQASLFPFFLTSFPHYNKNRLSGRTASL